MTLKIGKHFTIGLNQFKVVLGLDLNRPMSYIISFTIEWKDKRDLNKYLFPDSPQVAKNWQRFGTRNALIGEVSER